MFLRLPIITTNKRGITLIYILNYLKITTIYIV